MKCPRDGTALTSMGGSRSGILFCPACDGMWIEKSHVSDLLGGRDLRAGSPASASVPPVAGRRHPRINCPMDHAELMQQKVYDGIQVDICKSHQAFWLDGGEYDKLVAIHRAKRRHAGGGASASSGSAELAAELALEVALNSPELVIGVAESGSEMAEGILEFILEVLADIF